MTRYNDMSIHPENWTNAKLMREARSKANLETFANSYPVNPEPDQQAAEYVREVTRLYRETWLKPILDEIERRFVKKQATDGKRFR